MWQFDQAKTFLLNSVYEDNVKKRRRYFNASDASYAESLGIKRSTVKAISCKLDGFFCVELKKKSIMEIVLHFLAILVKP